MDSSRSKNSPRTRKRSVAAAPVLGSRSSKDLAKEIDAQVKTFVLETGGNKGTIFGGDGCFAVGVEKEELVHDIRTGVRTMGLFVPKGFSEGREVKPPEAPSKGQTFEEFLDKPSPNHVAFGRISWDCKAEPANYIRIPSNLLPENYQRTTTLVDASQAATQSDTWALPHLLTMFAQRVWCLKQPKLVISMVGSTLDFDLDLNVHERNAIFNGVIN